MLTLYARKGTGSIAPQIVLEELGLPHRIEWIDRDAAARAEYRRVNPTGKIPALGLADGSVIFESAAMVIHLTDGDRAARLAPPPGTPGHGRYLQWMIFLSANLYEAYLRFFYAPRYSTAGEAATAGIKDQASADILRHYEVIEGGLAPFLVGDSPTAADIYLYMLSNWHKPSPAELETRFPRLKALRQAIAARPAVAKVMAINRP